MPQLLLFSDPRPLVERLGREFFQNLPVSPGVYLMRDATDTVLYVGKAKNLKRRLSSYRVANPERIPRRHLRLLRSVARIDLQECQNESAALARESELLLSLKPTFNRAGTHRAPPRFLNWRVDAGGLDLRLTTSEPETDYEAHGPMKGGCLYFHHALARLLWWALHPNRSLFDLPAGWIHGRLGERARIALTADNADAADIALLRLQHLLRGELEFFSQWIQERTNAAGNPLELAVRDLDLETIRDYLRKPVPVSQLHGCGRSSHQGGEADGGSNQFGQAPLAGGAVRQGAGY
jgi:predicted GIY-YIG superfamily endonuclease